VATQPLIIFARDMPARQNIHQRTVRQRCPDA
jgi:hypothetical protein